MRIPGAGLRTALLATLALLALACASAVFAGADLSLP